ncbi:hypothetical protein [Bdellovibrio reynosensis]|uniref:Transglycosylase SLT domain-containing protein n=1 Tax=Bdellovibrio reynosensis TaxID=2835041 RepID=A0ABY4C9D6_9BACT|nr:hypothetical protein [Bdellovibrio reynosensis]UOF01542.1 hypothetical protein MNR06_01060 [Bdellovibrio reynosensis]
MQKIKGKSNLVKFALKSQLLLLTAAAFIGCADSSTDLGSQTSAMDSASSHVSSVAPLWESEHQDGKQWTSHVLRQLDVIGTDLLDVIPSDYATWCPNYKNLTYNERKDFWAYLLSQMTRYESGFAPEKFYTESFSDSKGKKVISRGLLQLSIESGNAYGCGFRTSKDVHDPEQNLACGVRILNRWVGKDGRIGGNSGRQWRGGARYWSVLRSSSGSYQKIVKATKSISICQK